MPCWKGYLGSSGSLYVLASRVASFLSFGGWGGRVVKREKRGNLYVCVVVVAETEER